MKVLVINCGSSSIKYQIIETENEDMLCKGLVELAGDSSTFSYQRTGADKLKETLPLADHAAGVAKIIATLTDPEIGIVKDASEIGGIGHRVVMGADKYTESVLIDDAVKAALKEYSDLAPLHNPANLVGIEAAEKAMPGAKNVAVFDTAFHQTMASEAFLYPIPYEYYEKYGVRKYGFHGTSHRFISIEAAKALNNPAARIISCHIGNGGSLAAIKDGKCVDTTMGLTPLAGIMMGTRSGDVDPSVITYIMSKENISAEDVLNILNKKSGLLGISGVDSDMRNVEAAQDKGEERSKLALRMYARRIRGFIGDYFVQLGGADAIVFTAGVGENDAWMRGEICKGLECLGVKIDEAKNKNKETVISADDSRVKVLMIPTNEELMIARDTAEIIGK